MKRVSGRYRAFFPRCAPGRPREGFTIVELLLVVVLLGIVLRIGAPHAVRVLDRARATEALARVAQVRAAAVTLLGEGGELPPESPPGQVPPELRELLGEEYSFEGRGYTLDWERWTLSDGLPSDPTRRQVGGVTLIPDDEKFGEVLRLVAGESDWLAFGSSYTWLIVQP